MGIVRIAAKQPITRKVWREFVQSDPELRFDGEDSVAWSGLPRDEFTLLVWRGGGIEARAPSESLLRKMGAIADAFDAVMSDDDGPLAGTYTTPTPQRAHYLDPLQWQMLAWGASMLLIVLAVGAMYVVLKGAA